MIRQSRGMTAEGRLSLSVPLRDRHKGRYAYNTYGSSASLPSPHYAGRDDGTAKIEGIPVFVEHNLRRVHIFQCLETIIYRKGFHQSGYLGGRIVETCFDGL